MRPGSAAAAALTAPALTAEDIPVGEARVVVVDGAEVAVFRTRGGAVHALDARCPHRGGPLADGLCDEQVVVCPLHGRAFSLTTGQEVDGELRVATRTARVEVDGTVRIQG